MDEETTHMLKNVNAVVNKSLYLYKQKKDEKYLTLGAKLIDDIYEAYEQRDKHLKRAELIKKGYGQLI